LYFVKREVKVQGHIDVDFEVKLVIKKNCCLHFWCMYYDC